MPFEFATASRIIFGTGTQDQIGALAKGFGERALLVTGTNLSRVRSIVDSLADSGVVTATFRVIVSRPSRWRAQGCRQRAITKRR